MNVRSSKQTNFAVFTHLPKRGAFANSAGYLLWVRELMRFLGIGDLARGKERTSHGPEWQ